MKNSKYVFDKITKLFEQGLISSRDLTNELMTILKSKRDEIVFKMKLKSKDEFEIPIPANTVALVKFLLFISNSLIFQELE